MTFADLINCTSGSQTAFHGRMPTPTGWLGSRILAIPGVRIDTPSREGNHVPSLTRTSFETQFNCAKSNVVYSSHVVVAVGYIENYCPSQTIAHTTVAQSQVSMLCKNAD